MIVGFDPGLGKSMPGGVCFMTAASCTAMDMPAAGKIVDVPHIVRCIASSPVDLIVIEKQHARPYDGHTSMNTALPAYGQLIGMCQAKGWPLKIVEPREWKRVVLKGTKRDKQAACAYVAMRYPKIDLRPGRRRKAHDGIADAVCIAEWGKRHFESTKDRSDDDSDP